MQEQPLVNGNEYAWANIEFKVLGQKVTGVKSINYQDEQPVEKVYGAGALPVAYTQGNYEATASIELLIGEVTKLQAIAPEGRLQNLPNFDVIVTYLPRENANMVVPVVTDTIRNCRFTTNARDVSQGDTEITVELPMVTSHIEWNQ